ncbi:hypothetical protein CHGG_10915 [Chaetomium globosum CBS 148.51]|uniref:Uncharacterized protein n=1 Tax=Chaetomium globosum (strain ATCC 6205 / CBS 148.51 / DSM 1962 / NBRC 6347 / NRRL 1970) TaxID=306901 RepID=Q2GM89_CHAGB|nr:uncharacterized protein CHGG_10915 [Chaetomium globosum CBS 148.51]EAQ83097.1 hypothetical protein CHGG_10915 [Chaetomium globosum CBS 148.51]
MALQTSTPSSLILLDTNYLTRITARRALLTTHPRTVLGVLRPAGHAPVHELYTYLLGTYLPARYPTLFQVTTSRDPSTAPHTVRVGFRNCVTGRTAPLYPGLAGAEEMLTVLGETVEDDLFLLLPEGVGGGKGGAHRLVAFVCCHPSGFDPVEKLGKRLAGIHEPVPGYEKIAGSMERYFARLQWSIQTHPHLFAPSGNHIHSGEEVDEEADIDIEKIKEEGLGPELADAIEGLKAGNAPGMWRYKGAVRWGTAVCEYLRAEGKNERPTLG